MQKTTFLFTLLLAMSLGAPLTTKSTAQSGSAQPAFTLHSQITTYQSDGSQSVSEVKKYAASNGSNRFIQTYTDGSVTKEHFCVQGRGYFEVYHRDKLLIQDKNVPPTVCGSPLRSAEQLSASQQFVGTETVLGITAYVHRSLNQDDAGEGIWEYYYYYVPEVGLGPIKRMAYVNGKLWYSVEPVSIVLGEPNATSLKVPNYPVIAATSVEALNNRAIEKPEAIYPSEAKAARVWGTVTVRIVVDEEGKVIAADIDEGHHLLNQAAVEAVHKARFSPTIINDEAVKVSGVLTYNFFLS